MLFILKTIIRWRKLILLSGLTGAVAMAVVSFFLPKWYRAKASIFPPETQSAIPFYADIMQSIQLPILGPSAFGTRPGTVYINILQSWTIGEQLIEEFDFKQVYGTPLTVEAIDMLHAHTSFTLLENGLLRLDFEDRDAGRAAAVTNRYVELLDEFNRHSNVNRASKTKEFISGQIGMHARDLESAEEALKEFQEKHRALELDEQVSSAIDVVSGLTAEAIALEVDLDILREYTAQSSEEYQRKKKRYDGLIDQIRKFKVVDEEGDADDVLRSFFPKLESVPGVSLEFARLLRRVKVEEKVYELLVTEYEKARIEEARDTPTVQVLDAATVPELRSRPKRKILVVIGGVLGLGWSSLLALFVTAWRESPARSGAWKETFMPLLSDFQRLFRKNR